MDRGRRAGPGGRSTITPPAPPPTGPADRTPSPPLPELLYVPDLAALLRISEKAVRQRAARGQLPPPFRLGKALAWMRDPVVAWLRDCGRSAGTAAMKITLRPYAHDKTRWHIDIRLMNPIPDAEPQELRKRLVAPAGLDRSQARAWGERQVPALLRAAMGEEPAPREEKTPRRSRTTTTTTAAARPAALAETTTARTRSPAARPANAATRPGGSAPRQAPTIPVAPPPPLTRAQTTTLGELYVERFEPEHVRLQKPGTQASYDVAFRTYICPLLGDLPLAAIDEDRLSSFRATIRQRLSPSTVNLVLAKVAKILRFARKVRILEVVPAIEKLPQPRPRPKTVYTDDEIDRLLAAAAELGRDTSLICLLALDAGLRVSEICALHWEDLDLDRGTITVQHSTYDGKTQTPKGLIGKVAMTAALRRALVDHLEAGADGPLVLYRRARAGRGEPAPHSRWSVLHLLNQAQRRAGLRATGPHFLRHTALTRLAELGASVYVVQAVARHSKISTTQSYLHTQAVGLAQEAATLLDHARRPGAAPRVGKTLAKLAKAPAT